MGRQGRYPGTRDIEAGLLKSAQEFIRQMMDSLIRQTPSAKSSVPTSPQPGPRESPGWGRQCQTRTPQRVMDGLEGEGGAGGVPGGGT